MSFDQIARCLVCLSLWLTISVANAHDVQPVSSYTTQTTSGNRLACVNYDVDIKLPVFSPASTYATLNAQIQQGSDKIVATFLTHALSIAPSASRYHQKQSHKILGDYTVFQNSRVTSVKVNFMAYNAPSAHPYHPIYTVNYDNQSQKVIALSDLFVPGSDYLQLLSDLSRKQLTANQKGNPTTLNSGTEPLLKNFAHWTFTQQGILLQFDEYQVAAYVEGQPTVLLTTQELSSALSSYGQQLLQH